jgi:hypothetical protein
MTRSPDEPLASPTWPALLIAVPLVVVALVASALRPRPGYRGFRLPASAGAGSFGPRLLALRRRLIGRSKAAVAHKLGPPRTAFLLNTVPSTTGADRPMFFQADTWYYPLNVSDRSAMAIQFENETVCGIEFLASRSD